MLKINEVQNEKYTTLCILLSYLSYVNKTKYEKLMDQLLVLIKKVSSVTPYF